MKPYYDHAGIQIFHGDCREILPQLPRVDVVISDPPPLRSGIDLSAACGKTVKQAAFIWAFDATAAPEFLACLSAINTCGDCYRVMLTDRYVYGIVAGESVLHPED